MFTTFHVGQENVYKQWALLFGSGAKDATSLQYVHEKIVSTYIDTVYGNLDTVFVGLDTVFDATNTYAIQYGGPANSILYAFDNTSIYYYGLPEHVVYALTNVSSSGAFAALLPSKWNRIVGKESASWVTDTTMVTLSPTSPSTIIENLNGTDVGDTNLTINGTTYKSDHAHHTGLIKLDSVTTLYGSMPLSLDVYMPYSLGAIGKIIIAPEFFNALDGSSSQYNGVERDLFSISY